MKAITCVGALLMGCTSSGAVTIGFDDVAGAQVADAEVPAGWRVGTTGGEAPHAVWQRRVDVAAPSPPSVLALIDQVHDSDRLFNVIWTDAPRFRNGRIAVSVRGDTGEVDQGGGPMWRVQDADNYYLCRLNPLELNFRVYVVRDGKRHVLGHEWVDAEPGVWYRIEVEHDGERITCSLDGKVLLRATDDSLPQAGGIGLWTKADARSSFDDLVVEPRD
jgi:hypothetical protein